MEVPDPTMDGNEQTVQEEIVAKDSYKVKLMVNSLDPNRSVCMEEDFKLHDEDVMTKTVNGIPSITFSDHVHKFIEKKMALSIVIKLLGRKIAFNTLLNKEKDDFDMMVLGGPWVVFDCYLIDARTDATVKGRFARLTVCVDLKKLLVSNVRINGRIQIVEYEGLSNICLSCRLFGHTSLLCTENKSPVAQDATIASKSEVDNLGFQSRVEEDASSKFFVLEAEREETRINNHRVSESIGTGVMEENLTIFSLKNEMVIEGCCVRRRDVRVNGKWVIGNFGLKSIGRILMPNNGAMAMEGIVGNLHKALEYSNVRFTSLTECENSTVVLDHDVGNDIVNVKILGLNFEAIHMWIVESCDEPWLIAGDFNSILDISERRGSATTTRSGCSLFQDFLFNNGLQDLGCCGSHFTWSRIGLSQRLDRALGNTSFDMFTLDCIVQNLHRLKSGHRPILVSLKPQRVRDKTFRCLDSWMFHFEFRMLVSNNWNYEESVVNILERFQVKV
ncbi:hypothetical protein CXB51_019495 [Gossypium anomalum]|uniref:DUF4283 domain-containing protein n=1 Tax=Gossypium anomalum TaxID=47600 RepID=A0A8J5YWB7_9ROSI|nr:hypothetical protein CXB51_019495 [Gossypium anomalum]